MTNLGWMAVALVLASPPASRPQRPTDAALRKAYERNRATLVEVWSSRGRGTGVVVGAGGHVATSVDHVGLDQATVRIGGEERAARVLFANARLGIALLQTALAPGESLLSAPVNAEATLPPGTWLVGVGHSKGRKLRPTAGRVLRSTRTRSPFIVTDLAVAPGTPLFDAQGRLVAIAVKRVGRIGSRALPIGHLQRQTAQSVAR